MKNGNHTPNTPVARRRRIADLLATESVKSQGQLEKLLAGEGLDVTQATLSRDLEDLGAVKIRDDSGTLVYAIPGQVDRRAIVSGDLAEMRLARRCADTLVSAVASGNLVVLRTPPGAAHFLASVIDGCEIDSVIGTIAGDDTVLLVTGSPDGGETVAAYLTSLAEGVEHSRDPQRGRRRGAGS